MQTGSHILTEAGHTTSIKNQPAKWTAHIDKTATQNQQWCTYMSQLCQECIFWILVLYPQITTWMQHYRCRFQMTQSLTRIWHQYHGAKTC